MEKIYHIKETAVPNQEYGESNSARDRIYQANEYDPTTETHPEQIVIRDYLNSLDEPALQEIFAEYYRKAGSDETAINWIPFGKVRIMHLTEEDQKKQKSMYGSYSRRDGVVLYSHLLCRLDPELTLWTLIHEECHAISHNTLATFPSRNKDGEEDGLIGNMRSGLALSVMSRKDYSDYVELRVYDIGIDEGVTELLTERIFKEYKRRLGLETYSQHLIHQNVKTSATEQIVAREKFHAYERNWQNARLYIGIISAISDIPENMVEEAVIRTYIRNGYILPDDMNPEVGEILDGIHPKLSTLLYLIINSEKDKDVSLRAYTDKINNLDISDELKKKISIAFQKVREEWGEAFKLAPYEV